MRIGLIAPVSEREEPRLPDQSERTVPLVAEALQAHRSLNGCQRRFDDPRTGCRADLAGAAPLASTGGSTTARLLNLGEAYERTSGLEVMHNPNSAFVYLGRIARQLPLSVRASEYRFERVRPRLVCYLGLTWPLPTCSSSRHHSAN